MIEYSNEKHGHLLEYADKYGYTAIEPYTVKNIEGIDCLLVKSLNSKFDNGSYYLRLDGDKGISLVINEANTIPTFKKTRETINTIENQLRHVDLSDHSVYDLVVIFSELIESNVLKPLAKTSYPEDSKKQTDFINVYTPLFCEKLMKYIISNDEQNIQEMQVLSEPYIIKTLLENKGKEN